MVKGTPIGMHDLAPCCILPTPDFSIFRDYAQGGSVTQRYAARPDVGKWGYGGSGHSQLALALLLDELDDEQQALEHYQGFKWDVIAHLGCKD